MTREIAYDEIDERGDELWLDTDRVSARLGRIAGALPYAAFGVLTESARRGGALVGRAVRLPVRVAGAAAAMPRRMVRGARGLPERAREAFCASERAGRHAVDRILGRKSLDDARRQIRTARSKARSVTTSTGKAARATAAAVEAVTSAAFDPRDTRPYEERTRGELYELAAERELDGRSGMTKKQLIQALRRAR